VILKAVSRPEEIKPGKTVSWNDEIKDLPPVQPTRLGGGCKLIELKYLLTVRSPHAHIYLEDADGRRKMILPVETEVINSQNPIF